MTEDQFIEATLDREGRQYAEPPQIDQPTGPGGITLPVLSKWRGRLCTVDDLRTLTVDESRAILRARIRQALSALHFDRIAFEPLRYQMLDYAWNSGEERAVRWLQRTAGLPEAQVTGVVDDRTIAAVQAYPPALLNNALAASRAHAAWHGGTGEQFAAGVARRAIEFVIDIVGDHAGEAGIA